MVLAGDVGGTKVELALFEFRGGRFAALHEERFKAKEFSALDQIVFRFLEHAGITPEQRTSLSAACFGVPGPVRQGRLKLTNLPWELDSAQLAVALKTPHVFLINDLEANAYGIAELPPEKFCLLNPGDPAAEGNRALMSAGTGLGEGMLVWNGHTHVPMASEGGHADFAARTTDEIELLRYLRGRLHGRVSCERVVSGIGLANIYSFCRDVKGMEEPAWLKERMLHEDPNAVIGELGQTGASELCQKTLDIFVSAYGAEAGNLGLRALAVGGVYVGGGIAPKILDKMRDGVFMKAFVDKGRLSGLLRATPVRIILDDKAALLGAAAYAEAQAAQAGGFSERAASAAAKPAVR